MAAQTPASEVRVLVDGLAYVESPRWHDGRLWFSHWGAEEVLAVDLEGNCEVAAPGRPGLGWATEWLPDGRLLVTGETLLRREPDGSFVVHTDISNVCTRGCSEIVVDGRGNIYINSIEFDFLGGGEPTGGVIALVTPDGVVRQVAGDLAFPNGMVVTPDNSTLIVGESFASRLTAFDIADDGTLTNRRTWAENVGPDGITMDAEGGIWASSAAMSKDCARIVEGGEITHRIALDRDCFACMLGGPDRRTLFMMTAVWLGPDKVDEALARRTGRVLSTEVDVPGVGWP
ncbi:MAG TPA: SMP-30/gluconolactonase/LRE family protein [Acidimicrobiales bacterium]|jgi:sugar lactone lactonase YvrE|nr:SMP-30/gluconolactonase/LRE family protein [Acidimicrobiales bacterium]